MPGHVVVAVGGREIERHRPGEVAGELRARSRVRRDRALDVLLVGGIQERGDPASGARVGRCLRQRGVAIVGGDHEADRPEAFLAVQVPAPPHRRRPATAYAYAPAKIRDARTAPRPAGHARDATPPPAIWSISAGVDADWIAAMIGAARFGSAAIAAMACASSRAELVGADAAARMADAIARHVDVLRRRAHLRREQAHRRGEALDHRLELVHRLDDDRVHARRLGVAERRVGVRLDPGAEARAAREIDDRGLRMLDQHLADRRLDACPGTA